MNAITSGTRLLSECYAWENYGGVFQLKEAADAACDDLNKHSLLRGMWEFRVFGFGRGWRVMRTRR
jgi:hypothetical protein